jgi:hypothetical protein
MNTKQNEFSIFQGVPSIHIDNNKLRAEEEETKADEIRRNAEVTFQIEFVIFQHFVYLKYVIA